MLFKLIKKATKIFLLNMIFVTIIFCLKVKAKDLIGEVVDLMREERELNRKIIELMTFELAEEQIPIAGDSEKYLLRDEKTNVWLFKPDEQLEIQNAVMFSNIAQLIGVDVPVVRGITFPINGKKVSGAIQKIGFDDILRLERIAIKDLSSSQILSLQKLQVLDWLLIVREGDKEVDTFIASKGSGKILAIDRDDCFKNINDGRILGLEGTDWDNSLYARLWYSYIRGEIDINFCEVFELINYIQQINDNEFREILCFLTAGREMFLKEILWRKANLKKEFKKFYSILAEKKKKLLSIPLKNEYRNYVENLLKKIKKRILTEELEYQRLRDRGKKELENIDVIASEGTWKVISYDLWGKKGKFDYYLELMKDLEINKRQNSFISINERLAIELYIEQLKTKKKSNIYRIIEHPKWLNPTQVESNLRINSYDIFLNNNLRKICILKEKGSILAHLRYIEIMKMENSDRGLMPMYIQKFRENPNETIYLFLAIMSETEYQFNSVMGKLAITNTDRLTSSLDKIDNQFPWKYYGYALCDYGRGCIQDGIKNCERMIDLNNDREAVYAAYMLLGFFYEHNSKNVRFGRGFDIKKAIKNYKKALEVNPNSLEAHLNLANLYLVEGLPTESLREFKKISNLNPQYAKEYFHLEDIRKAKSPKKYLETIKMNTLSGEGHYILGLAYTIKGQNKLAEKHFDKAREFGCKKCQRSKR